MPRQEKGPHFINVGEYLKKGREAVGMPQDILAGELGKSKQFISSIEKGESRMPWKMALDWCQMLGLNLGGLYRCIEKDMKEDFRKVTGCKMK